MRFRQVTTRLRLKSLVSKQKMLDNVRLIAEQANGIDIELEVGQASDMVTVTEASPLIDTETSNLSRTVDAKQIQTLPSAGRDPFQLLQLAPGAFGDGAQASGGGTANLPGTTIGGTGATEGVFKIENGGQISANGARTGENNYQIDGVGTTSVTWGGTSVITPNEDSIKEIKILTDNYDAENGRYRGAQVQIISQNGTKLQFTESAFFKAQSSRSGCLYPSTTASTAHPLSGCTTPCANVKTIIDFNDWGGTLGGPIVRNRRCAFFLLRDTYYTGAKDTSSSGWYESSSFRSFSSAGNRMLPQFFSFPKVGPNGG
jgi:hypothetical protein